MDRRAFLGDVGRLGSAVLMTPSLERFVAPGPKAPEAIRVGIIGCGSVSGVYLPHLTKSPYVKVVSLCDRIPDRAERRGEQFGVAHRYPSIDAMLAGEPFDLLLTLTDMQEHGHLNRQALEAGKHVWSEKPLANTYAEGWRLLELAREKSLRIWGAPAVVTSPHFAFMSRQIQAGALGRVAAAHATYGHLGPTWSSFFYEEGGGSLPDLGVYNLTTLTGLLGPVRAVMAMTGVITPMRSIDDKGDVRVTAEDNAMVLMDHGGGTFSHVQCGFNYFDPHGHEGAGQDRATISLVGTHGAMQLIGYDWEPNGVDLASADHEAFERHVTDAEGYVWEQGASYVAECLATGKESLIRPEHALHVLEIIIAARESQSTGRRIPIESSFRWPVL
ncbi:MAG: Gfo/Idh/MocA family oxidoreductase [Rhodothermales bacterium]